MKLEIHCPECRSFSKQINLKSENSESGEIHCPEKHAFRYQIYPALQKEFRWERCPVCDSIDVYRQKDVPKRTLVFVLGVVLALTFVIMNRNWYLGMGILILMAVLDWILFRTLPDALVCYQCHSKLSGIPDRAGKEYPVHDPHVAERYRQLRVQR